MPSTSYAGRARFGLLPEPETNATSLVTSFLVNGSILALALIFGTLAHHEIEQRKMESTEIVFPTPPPPVIKVKVPPPPKMPPPPEVKVAKLDLPKINLPKAEPKPEMKPVPIVKETAALKMDAAKPQIILAPQPKAALTAAAPAPTPQAHPSTQQVHLGEMTGVVPNANASKPATISALGNPYGGAQGAAAMPHGVVGSTGIGNGVRSGSNAGGQGKIASAGIPGGNGTANSGGYGSNGTAKVASAGIPAMANAGSPPAGVVQEAKITAPVLLSHGEPEYTAEGRQLKIQGEVILRVTITTTGHMEVLSVIHGLGHGLDEAAMRSAPTYKFQPATKNGQPVEYTTNIRIKFQTA